MSININGHQIAQLLELAWPDHGNPKEAEQGETEISLRKIETSFTSTDGDEMPAGIYMHYADYPEEGSIYLPETGEPANSAPTEKQIVKDFTRSMTKAGYNVDQSSALTVLKVILNDLQETSARLKKIAALADETLSPPTLGELS